jgi:Zn-dependent alcohol dehydrogenase
MEDYYFGPDRFDVIIDTAGVITRANLLAKGGRYIMVGQPLPEMTLQPFTAGWIFQGNGGRVEATNGGGFNPTKDIPRYVQMWRDGKLDDYKKIITHRIKLDEINHGISLMRDGKAGRVLIEM